MLLEPKVLVSYRLGSLEDLNRLNSSQFDYDQVSLSYSTRRLAAGDAFVLGEVDGQVAFYCWLIFGRFQANMDQFWPAPKDMVCVYKVFTHQAHRGQSIYPASYHFIAPLAKKLGMNRFTTSIKEINLPCRRSAEKVGYQQHGRIYCWQLIGKKHHRPNARTASLLAQGHRI